MNPQDILITIAEIAIGLAGFSGLVAAFVHRSDQTWGSDQKTRIVFLIVLSFGMIVGALSPFALSGLTDATWIIWGLPMIGFSVLSLTLLFYWLTVSRKRGYKVQFPIISIPIVTIVVILQSMVLLSGLGVFFPYSPALFIFGFLAILVFGANVFLALLNTIWD